MNHKLLMRSFLSLLCWNVCVLNAQNSNGQMLAITGNAFADIAEIASPAVVSVRVSKILKPGEESGADEQQTQDPFEDFFRKFFQDQQGQPGGGGREYRFETPRPRERRKLEGLGSGFTITSDGYILTNYHVVSQADKVQVKFSDGKEFTAKVIGTDPPTDIALVKVDASGLPTLEFGDSDQLRVGQWAIAIGNPFGLTSTVTVGVVSAKGRTGIGIEDYEDFIQTDAAINVGNSGGPLLDAHGKVIGITTAIVSQSGGSMGIGFAIPANMVKMVYEQLQKTGTVTRGYLGVVIQQLTPELAKSFNLDAKSGVLIADVAADSPAEKAGIKRGDVITRLNDKPADKINEFRNYVATLAPGSTAKLEIYSGGKQRIVDLTIGKLPGKKREKSVMPESEENGSRLGITAQNVTSEIASKLGLKDSRGVVVTEVEPGSPADEQGLEPGTLILEVEHKAVANTDEFRAAVREAIKKGAVLLLIKQDEYTQYIVIDLNKK